MSYSLLLSLSDYLTFPNALVGLLATAWVLREAWLKWRAGTSKEQRDEISGLRRLVNDARLKDEAAQELVVENTGLKLEKFELQELLRKREKELSGTLGDLLDLQRAQKSSDN